MDYFDVSQFGTGAQQRFTGQSPWGSGEMQNSLEQGVMQGTELFKQQFQNLLGRAPTADELGAFQTNALASALPNGVNPGYGDLSGIASSYIQNQFGPQAAAYSQQQQTDQLGKSQGMIQDLINKTMGNTASSLADPTSQIYQQLAGSMNNMGITPSSGAFQAGAGSTIANSGMNAANMGLEAIGIPGIQGIAQTGQNPYQQSFGAGNQALGNLENINNFNAQSQLGLMLQQMMEPSTAQKDIGMASGASNALGNLAKFGPSNAGTSYVCMELIRQGLICEMDMDDFHVHIMPAMFRKGRAFWKYAVDGKKLVDAVNEKGLEWKHFKHLLFDRVMEEPDPCKAVDLYADACHQLCISCDRSLWDERVYRHSVWDSLIFLPRLFLYKPFMKALWKCFRIRTLILYDRPRCDHAIR